MITNNQPPKKEKSIKMTEFIKLKNLDKDIKKDRKLKPKDELPPPPPPPQEQPQQKIVQMATPEMEIPELEAPQPDLLTNSDIKLAAIKPKPLPKPKPKVKLRQKPKAKPKVRIKQKAKPKPKAKAKPRFKPRFKTESNFTKPKVQAVKAPKKRVKAAPKVKKKVYSPVTSPKPRKIVRKKPVKKAAPKMSNRVSSNVSATYRAPVKYPKRAANRRQQGWVKVQFIITASGGVSSPFVVASSPSSVFNKAALRSIRRWKFRPKVVNGQRVAQRAVQTIKFRLR